MTPFFALVVVPVLGIISALVIELGRAELIATKLQTASDAVALASTVHLDGTISGWLDAKRAAFNTLRHSSIMGHDGSVAISGEFGDDLSQDPYQMIDSMELGSNYESAKYRIGNLVITIHRGFYGWVEDAAVATAGNCPANAVLAPAGGPSSYRFVNLEGTCDFATKVVDTYRGYDCATPTEGCNIAWVANATRVTLTLAPYPTVLTGLLPGGASALGTLSKESTSALEDFPPNPILPVVPPVPVVPLS